MRVKRNIQLEIDHREIENLLRDGLRARGYQVAEGSVHLSGKQEQSHYMFPPWTAHQGGISGGSYTVLSVFLDSEIVDELDIEALRHALKDRILDVAKGLGAAASTEEIPCALLGLNLMEWARVGHKICSLGEDTRKHVRRFRYVQNSETGARVDFARKPEPTKPAAKKRAKKAPAKKKR